MNYISCHRSRQVSSEPDCLTHFCMRLMHLVLAPKFHTKLLELQGGMGKRPVHGKNGLNELKGLPRTKTRKLLRKCH